MASSSHRTNNPSHGADNCESDEDKDYDCRGGEKKHWSVEATMYYIKLLEKYKERLWSPVTAKAHYRVRNSIWADLTMDMIKAGYQYNHPQCRKKLENMKRRFHTCTPTPRKRVKFITLSNGKRKKVKRTSRSVWPFYSQFLPIMKYINANMVGSDKYVASRSSRLKKAAPILQSARIEEHLDNLETNTNESSTSPSSQNTSIDENEDSVIEEEELIGSEYNQYRDTNGIANGLSDATSMEINAFHNFDLGYGSEIMTLQAFSGDQDYYQKQTFNSQPNTEDDILSQEFDLFEALRGPVKVEPVPDYDYAECENVVDMDPVSL